MKSERVPQTGAPAVEGIAIGRAVIWAQSPPPQSVPGTPSEEHGRIARAHQRATRGVDEMVRDLSPAEAELFLPEVAILAELGPLLKARVAAGATAEEAILETTARVSTDLLLDARARLFEGLDEASEPFASLFEGRAGDLVLVTDALTPSVVASLPARVVGIVAAMHGSGSGRSPHASHAVILARGRGIPLAFLPQGDIAAFAEDAAVILDATDNPAAVWTSPDEAIRAAAEQRRIDWQKRKELEEEDESAAPNALSHLGVEVHVNIGSVHERFPRHAAGIGLLRTELLFSGHTRPPSELEQLAALRAIAAPLGDGPLVVRLFDAGGDKPLAWIKAPPEAPDARGVELLFFHPELLDNQLRAIVRAAEHVRARVLLPLVRNAEDVNRVRAKTFGRLPVGAMVETPAAVGRIDELAAAADFICIGTNDLFATFAGQGREDAAPPLDPRALALVGRATAAARAKGRRVTVCGEMAGDPLGAQILVGLGVDAISVAPARFAKIKRSLKSVTLDDCRRAAEQALMAKTP
jgi:phosphoenolpyruvate-protein kinase (PTS system EI component)